MIFQCQRESQSINQVNVTLIKVRREIHSIKKNGIFSLISLTSPSLKARPPGTRPMYDSALLNRTCQSTNTSRTMGLNRDTIYYKLFHFGILRSSNQTVVHIILRPQTLFCGEYEHTVYIKKSLKMLLAANVLLLT